MGDRETTLAGVAHVLRRTTFGPFPGHTERALDAHGSVAGVVEAQISAPPLPFESRLPWAKELPNGGLLDIDGQTAPNDALIFERYLEWWVTRMRSDEAGLHEKMSWFWHTVLTTSNQKILDNNMNWRQLRTLHQHALGNYGDLLKAIAVDGSMLVYLDGNYSNGRAPNENFARELMELFSLGIGHYTEADVRAGAKIFSGWHVNREESVLPTARAVEFVPADSYQGTVTFLGRTGHLGPDDAIDAILAQPACAPFVVRKLWKFFVGGEPDTAVVHKWASDFRASGYEIAPLVATILRSAEFQSAQHTRARTPIEWNAAVVRAAGLPVHSVAGLTDLGQRPYLPPSVAGWPGDSAWLTSSQFVARERFLAAASFDGAVELVGAPNLVNAVLQRCGLYDVSRSTRTTLDRLASDLSDEEPVVRAATVMSCAFMTPEFSLA